MRRMLVLSLAITGAASCRASSDEDMSQADASSPDASADAAAPALFGTIGGDCDVLDDELTSAEPSVFRSTIDFPREFSAADTDQLTPGGQEIIADDNAGGSSLYSETFAHEVIARCEAALLLNTENEIEYDPQGAKTDFLTEIDTTKIGVSVTRAMSFPLNAAYELAAAQTLLEDKLADCIESTANAKPAFAWQKQILAVVAYGPAHADTIEAALANVDAAIKSDTIVWIIVTDGADLFIYTE